jgi:hypothetical protein
MTRDFISAEKYYSFDHQATRQNWRVAAWCTKKGIPVDTIEGHPHYDDILFLMQFQDEFEAEYKTSVTYYNSFSAYWSIVIKDRKALSKKAYKKFEQIAQACLDIRQQTQTQLNKIKSLRHTLAPAKLKNMDHDMMAKGSCSPQKLTHKGNYESAVEKLPLPWED